MKKINKLVVMILLLSMILSNISFATTVQEPVYKVNVNGSQLQLTSNPTTLNGNILVPLKSVFESLGAKIEWDQATKTITSTKDTKIVKLQSDNNIAKINDLDVALSSSITIINGTTYAPTSLVSDLFGAIVNLDKITNTIAINTDYTRYNVVRVVDGDTIKVMFNGKEESVRLIGIDTPESVHPDASKNVAEGKTASDYTKALIEGKDVALEFDVQQRDHYGRLLAYVYFNGTMVNKTLLKEGYAQISTYPPNVKYVEDFTALQKMARESNKGLWSQEQAVTTPTITTPTTPAPSTNNSTGKFKGSIKSDKYHYATYTHSGQIADQNLIWFDSIEDAKAQGYKPCGNCFK